MNWCKRLKTAAWTALVLAVGAGCEPGYVKSTTQFAARVKSVVSPEELQAWATNLIAKTTIPASAPVEVKQADIPNALRGLYEYPPDADIVGLPGSTTAHVEIWYGSGSGHWGLYIGDSTLVMSSSKTHYIVPWKSGVYFWSGP
jgi:hypothetical protein